MADLRRADVLAYLQRETSLGKPFPTASQIAKRFEQKFAATATNALRALASEGHLVAERVPDSRAGKWKYVYRLAGRAEGDGEWVRCQQR